MRMSLAPVLIGLVLAGPVALSRADGGGDLLSIDGAQSSISYQIVHKLHKVKGTSKRAEGRGRILPGGQAQVAVRASIESFDSGNSNRDAHMKETVDAARFPQVELKAAGQGVAWPSSYPATVDKIFQVELSFHGVRKTLQIPAKLTFPAPGQVRATSHFDVSLDEFKVERPSLMFVKVDDAMQIDVDLLFKR